VDVLTPRRVKTIAHILPFPAVGGTEHATARIARAVDPSRFRNIAFCVPEASAVVSLFLDLGIPATTYSPAVASYRHGVAFVQSSLRLAREFKAHEVDVVHCADLLAGYYAGLAGRLARIPVICHIRNRFDNISARDRSFLWPVNQFVFVSQNTREHFGHRVRSRDGIVIYDGIDVPGATSREDVAAIRAEFGVGNDVPVVGMLARVAPQKDYATLVKAAAGVLAVEPSTRFLIVGDNSSPGNREHYAAVQQMLVQAGVAPSFIFTGERPDARRILSAIDIFVLSTHREGLPLVLLEAMAQSKAVIATSVDGVPELVHHGTTGLLCSHQDHRQLAEHVIRLIQSPAQAKLLGDAGREFVQTRFTTKQFADNMNALYVDVLGLDR
jgi:glycosyltransferase involved in cell wall biosynthesis